MNLANVTSSASSSYLDAVAATDVGRSYKLDLLAALRIEPGQTVLDVGCGPGTDLAALADATGPDGRVYGVDQDPKMVETARVRLADRPNVEIRPADAHRLPFEAGSIDRARTDRVLMHVAEPGAVLGEFYRVLRPAGLLALAEPDFDTLAVDHPRLALSRAFTRCVADRVTRNPAMGRQLPRLAVDAGFTVRSVHNAAAVLTDFETAETILGLRRNAERAVAAGYFSADDAHGWLEHLTSDTFLATVSFITLLAERNDGAWIRGDDQSMQPNNWTD